MSFRADLSCSIEVTSIAVFAEMAWMEPRPELALLCQRSLDTKQPLTGPLISQILPGLSPAGSHNILTTCQRLGLCEGGGTLTQLGHEVAKSGLAPVPEQGVYHFLMARHPLLGGRILAAERLTPERDTRLEWVKPLPWLPEMRRVFTSVVDPGEQFILREIPSNSGERAGIPLPNPAHCTLRWNLAFESGHQSWHLDGYLEVHNHHQPLQHSPEATTLDLWALMERWGKTCLTPHGQWSPQRRWLAIPFENATENERESFRKDITCPQVEVPGFGPFTGLTLYDTPIAPVNPTEASQWANDRFARALLKQKAFRSRSQVADLFVSKTRGTPLETFDPPLPAHEVILPWAKSHPEVFWNVAAPVDLAPTPPSSDELDQRALSTLPSPAGKV